jgi:pterin-4a-carbinolamine dehydratase
MSWTENNNQLSREYDFGDFLKAVEFVDRVGSLTTGFGVQPEIKLSQGKLEITISSSNQLSNEEKEAAQSIELEYTKFSNALDFALDADTGKKIRLPIQTRLRNQLIVGKQGGGKSLTVTKQILQDINQGRGVCVFDPNGEIIDDVYKDLNEDQKKNTILLDFANKNNNFSLNLFDKQYTEVENLEAVNNLFNTVFEDDDSSDPVYSSFLNNGLSLVLQSQEQLTFDSLVRVFSDQEFRNDLVNKTQNQDVKTFWQDSIKTPSSENNLEVVAGEVVAKINKFIRSEFLKEYLVSTKPSFDFSSLITSNKNIFIKLPVKVLTQEIANVIASTLFLRLKQSLNKRDFTSSEYFIYIDNFEKLANYVLLELLEDSKSIKTGFVLTLNSLRKIVEILDEDAIDQILENTAIHTLFKCEYLDAEIINQWYNDQVDIESLRDPIKYGGYIFFDDNALSFES